MHLPPLRYSITILHHPLSPSRCLFVRCIATATLLPSHRSRLYPAPALLCPLLPFGTSTLIIHTHPSSLNQTPHNGAMHRVLPPRQWRGEKSVWFDPGSNWGPSACEADVITTTPPNRIIILLFPTLLGPLPPPICDSNLSPRLTSSPPIPRHAVIRHLLCTHANSRQCIMLISSITVAPPSSSLPPPTSYQ